jgi:hypothetical protein
MPWHSELLAFNGFFGMIEATAHLFQVYTISRLVLLPRGDIYSNFLDQIDSLSRGDLHETAV